MARAKTSLTGLFARLLQPVADALQAETGHEVTTAGWVRVVRSTAARWARELAAAIDPPATADPRPVAVHVSTPTPVAPETRPVAAAPPALARRAVPKPAKPARSKPKKPRAKPVTAAARTTKKPAAKKSPARRKPKGTPAKAGTPRKRPAAAVA